MTKDTPLDRWTSISLAAALILNRLRNKQQIETSEEETRKPEHEKQEHERSKLTVIGWP